MLNLQIVLSSTQRLKSAEEIMMDGWRSTRWNILFAVMPIKHPNLGR